MTESGRGEGRGQDRAGVSDEDRAGVTGGEDELQPLSWSPQRIALWGTAAWAVALVVTLVVPALHGGDRSWWPWTCVAGMAIGVLGHWYLRRGRGNAEGS